MEFSRKKILRFISILNVPPSHVFNGGGSSYFGSLDRVCMLVQI